MNKFSVGSTTVNHQGLKMTIIKRIGRKIDVQFEDGTVVKDKWINGFMKACICNPNYSNSKTISRNEFCFYYYLKNYGFKHFEQGQLKKYGLGQYTVDLFNPDLMVAIEYDGRFHRKEKDHRKNKAFAKHGISIIRVREPRADVFDDGISINFYIANGNNFDPALTQSINEVVYYLNQTYDININDSIDVVRDKDEILNQYFEETDYLLRNKRIGERYQNNQGLWFEIVDYRNKNDIDIKFDIDGLVLKHKDSSTIRAKKIAHPKYNRTYFDRKERLGQTRTNNAGLEMTIVEYRNSTDIDVAFKDGTIVKHVEYHNFQRGQVNPVKKKRIVKIKIKDPFKNPIGKRFKTNRGLWIEIIDYRSAKDVDVKFDIDGTILKHRNYQLIKKGILPHPNRIDLIGETIINKEGFETKLIKYRNCKDVDILFIDDNSIVKHKRYYKFQNGSVKHP